jgi:RNase adapter protein RapZ
MVKVDIFSFSIKYRLDFPPPSMRMNFLFDCRGVKNPGRVQNLREKTGLDTEVIDFLHTDISACNFLTQVTGILESTLSPFQEGRYGDIKIGFSCTGGQHRSVYFAERAKKLFQTSNAFEVNVQHLDILSFYSAHIN